MTGDASGTISTDRLGRQIAWIALALALGGLALGLVPMTLGSFGEQQIDTPGSNDQDLSDEQKTIRDAQQKNQVIQYVVTFGPFIGIALGVGLGLVVGVAGEGSPDERALAVAIGSFLGVALFVFLSAALAMQQWWAVEGAFGQRWLQWDSAIWNAVLYAAPAGLLAPIAAVSSDWVRS